MPATIPQTETILKSYFETGDKPTPLQFEELVGTQFYLFQQAMDAAQAAQDDAAEVLARQVQAAVKATWSGSVYNRAPGYINVEPITISEPALPIQRIRVTWTTPFADTNYKFFLTAYASGSSARNPIILAQNAAYLEFRFMNDNESAVGTPQFHLVAFS